MSRKLNASCDGEAHVVTCRMDADLLLRLEVLAWNAGITRSEFLRALASSDYADTLSRDMFAELRGCDHT